jgi:hypothetical protein
MRMASWRWPRAVLALLGRIPGDPMLWTPLFPPGTARVGEAAARRLLVMLGGTISQPVRSQQRPL